jgi:ribosome biogenesis GTPase
MKGLVIKSTGSWYIVQLNDGKIINARLRGKFKIQELKITNPIAVGDIVELAKETNSDSYIIEDILKRDNYLIRKSTRKTAHGHLLGSNVDQAILLITLSQPRTSLGFIDRFLVSCESFRIKAILIFNKIDLYSEKEIAQLHHYKSLYETLGYEVYFTSILENKGLTEVKEKLEGKTSIIAGHSGVGKTSFLNAVCPHLSLRTSEISSYTDKGVHTTTFAEMHFINPNSKIIDTPGVKEWGLYDISNDELSHFFPEMRAEIGNCKYHNCKHINEPQCKILSLVKEGIIKESRYLNYLNILEDDLK